MPYQINTLRIPLPVQQITSLRPRRRLRTARIATKRGRWRRSRGSASTPTPSTGRARSRSTWTSTPSSQGRGRLLARTRVMAVTRTVRKHVRAWNNGILLHQIPEGSLVLSAQREFLLCQRGSPRMLLPGSLKLFRPCLLSKTLLAM